MWSILKTKKNYNNKKGFTLAEVMMTIAIIAILAGVTFVGVTNYLRSMAQLEMDGIAKEIYIAAQNHLTMAEGQNFLGVIKKGDSVEINDKSTKYYIVNKGIGDFNNSTLGLMLPFGSVDETVRMGGNYIIHYQEKPALVLDVYYSGTGSGARYPQTFNTFNQKFYDDTNNKSNRRGYGKDNSVIGYYGAEDADSLEPKTLVPPSIKVINAEKLKVEIADPNKDAGYESLQLVVKGDSSGAEQYIDIKIENELKNGYQLTKDMTTNAYVYTVTLDDITAKGNHFYDLFQAKGFIPGENISIQAKAFSKSSLCNIATSAVQTTNSLFADINYEGEERSVLNSVSIGNIRHLENLDSDISKVSTRVEEGVNVSINNAVQESDLSWKEFKEAIGNNNLSIYKADQVSDSGTKGFYPVCPGAPLSYDGCGYRITDIEVEYFPGDSGLFGKLESGSRVENLELIDFSVYANKHLDESSSNAGALIGHASGTNISNVLVYNTEITDSKMNNITNASGSAGGLVGLMEGGNITNSAAAIYVNASGGDAGGLVGKVVGKETDVATITGSYSGGHTINNNGKVEYSKEVSHDSSSEPGDNDKGLVNVIGTRSVGGLVGNAGNAAISSSYSTCSVYGKDTITGQYVGGLVGEAAGGSIKNCYAVGYVSGSAEKKAATNISTTEEGDYVNAIGSIGAFAGHLNIDAINLTGNHYYMIVNERYSDKDGFYYLSPVGSTAEKSGITAIDKDVSTYQQFVGSTWTDAEPYNDLLGQYYHDTDGNPKYNLKSVQQLGAEIPSGEGAYEQYVTKHYGDWPAPEIFVINEKAS